VGALLREAGLRGRPEALAPLGFSTSSVWALDVGCAAYVVRWRLDGDPRMADKEAYLNGLLRRHDGSRLSAESHRSGASSSGACSASRRS
jgi:hypothetical protein